MYIYIYICIRGIYHTDNHMSSDVFLTNLLKNTVCNNLQTVFVFIRNKVQFFFFTFPLWP